MYSYCPISLQHMWQHKMCPCHNSLSRKNSKNCDFTLCNWPECVRDGSKMVRTWTTEVRRRSAISPCSDLSKRQWSHVWRVGSRLHHGSTVCQRVSKKEADTHSTWTEGEVCIPAKGCLNYTIHRFLSVTMQHNGRDCWQPGRKWIWSRADLFCPTTAWGTRACSSASCWESS